jgi:predicted amidohydrolase
LSISGNPYVLSEARLIARQMIPVRAFENQIFIAYANHTGRDSRFSYAGLSHIAAPDGRTLAKASATQEGLIFTYVIPGDYARSLAANPSLSDLRQPSRPAKAARGKYLTVK